MALRNIDLASAIRGIYEDTAAHESLRAVCADKIKELDLKADKSQAKTPERFGGRRLIGNNPRLKNRFKGGGDINVRGLLDWVHSIEPLPELGPDEVPSPEYLAMSEAHAQLIQIHATIVANTK
jgi:hypothetical protein